MSREHHLHPLAGRWHGADGYTAFSTQQSKTCPGSSSRALIAWSRKLPIQRTMHRACVYALDSRIKAHMQQCQEQCRDTAYARTEAARARTLMSDMNSRVAPVVECLPGAHEGVQLVSVRDIWQLMQAWMQITMIRLEGVCPGGQGWSTVDPGEPRPGSDPFQAFRPRSCGADGESRVRRPAS